MKKLVIYPSFLCPFACQYCFFRDKLSLSETLNLQVLQDYLKNNQDIDSFVISGGDPLSLSTSYMNELLSILQAYNKPITLEAYPYRTDTIPSNINYNFSYDFLTKPRASDAWESLLNFKNDFKITITLSPLLFKYHPNNLLKKLALLPHLTEVEFIPYLKNEYSQYNITKNNGFETFIKTVLNCKLNLPFKITNKEILKKMLVDDYETSNDLHLFPNGKTYQKCIENDIVVFKESSEFTQTKYPFEIDSYNPQILLWFKNNALN